MPQLRSRASRVPLAATIALALVMPACRRETNPSTARPTHGQQTTTYTHTAHRVPVPRPYRIHPKAEKVVSTVRSTTESNNPKHADRFDRGWSPPQNETQQHAGSRSVVENQASLLFRLQDQGTDGRLVIRAASDQTKQEIDLFWNDSPLKSITLTKLTETTDFQVAIPDGAIRKGQNLLRIALPSTQDSINTTPNSLLVERVDLTYTSEADPPAAIGYKRLASQVQSDVLVTNLPGTLIFSAASIPDRARLDFGYGVPAHGVPSSELSLRVHVMGSSGDDRETIFETRLNNLGKRKRVPVDSATADANKESVRALSDGIFGAASTWHGKGHSGETVRMQLEEPRPLTAFALSSDATNQIRAGVPSQLKVETIRADGSVAQQRTIAHHASPLPQWHLLSAEKVATIVFRIDKTHDGNPPRLDEIVLSEEPTTTLPNDLGIWHRTKIDLDRYSGQEIVLSFEITPSCGNSQRCPQRAFLTQPIITAPPKENARNLVVVSMDTVRSHRLSAFGYDRPTTPFLDSLIQRPGSIHFSQCRSSSTWTTPSHLSLFTGLTPFRHRVNVDFPRFLNWATGKGNIRPLDPRIKTLPELMRDWGYLTVALSSPGTMKGEIGFQRGFDVYHDHFNLAPNEPMDLENELVSKRILTNEWLNHLAGRPFFLFLHSFAAHFPYHRNDLAKCDTARRSPLCRRYTELIRPTDNQLILRRPKPSEDPQLLDSRFFSDLYDSNLLAMDTYLRQVVDQLDSLGLLDTTVLVITSDHGEAFAEHLTHYIDAHGQSFYDEYLRVPLIFLLPEGQAPEQNDAAVSTVDILPSILDYIGIPKPPGLEGTPLLNAPATVPTDRTILYQTLASEAFEDHHFIAASRKNLKILANPYNLYDGKHELYDLSRDPDERHNLAGSEDGIAADLLATIDRHIQESFRGMLVVDISSFGRGTRTSVTGTFSIEHPAEIFETAIRRKVEYVKRTTKDPGTEYEFKLQLNDNDRRLIGFEVPPTTAFSIQLGPERTACRLSVALDAGRGIKDSKRLHAGALTSSPEKQVQSAGHETGCWLNAYYLPANEVAEEDESVPADVDRSIDEEQREAVLEQMRKLGYLGE